FQDYSSAHEKFRPNPCQAEQFGIHSEATIEPGVQTVPILRTIAHHSPCIAAAGLGMQDPTAHKLLQPSISPTAQSPFPGFFPYKCRPAFQGPLAGSEDNERVG